jgi:hypothetical protein
VVGEQTAGVEGPSGADKGGVVVDHVISPPF